MFVKSEIYQFFEHYGSIYASHILHVITVVTSNVLRFIFSSLFVYLFFSRGNNISQELKNKFKRKEKEEKTNTIKRRYKHTQKSDIAVPNHTSIFCSGISKAQGSQSYNYLPIQKFFHQDMMIRTSHEKRTQNEQEYIYRYLVNQ